MPMSSTEARNRHRRNSTDDEDEDDDSQPKFLTISFGGPKSVIPESHLPVTFLQSIIGLVVMVIKMLDIAASGNRSLYISSSVGGVVTGCMNLFSLSVTEGVYEVWITELSLALHLISALVDLIRTICVYFLLDTYLNMILSTLSLLSLAIPTIHAVYATLTLLLIMRKSDHVRFV